LILDTSTTRVTRITGVTDTNPTWTCISNGTLVTGNTFDLIGASGTLNDVYGEYVTIVGSAVSFTVPHTSLRHPPRVNDWLVGYPAPTAALPTPVTPVVPLPEEMAPVVVARVAARVLESMGYLAEAASKWQSADAALASARRLLTPRSDGNPKVLAGGINEAIRGPWYWAGFDWR
jgi:hypothetical protein